MAPLREDLGSLYHIVCGLVGCRYIWLGFEALSSLHGIILTICIEMKQFPWVYGYMMDSICTVADRRFAPQEMSCPLNER